MPQEGKSVEIDASTSPSGITPTEKPIITPEKVQPVSQKSDKIATETDDIRIVDGEVNESKVKLDELNTAIAKLKADNPNEFKKDGTLKASSKIAPALKSLSDKRAEAADKYAKEFPELSKKAKRSKPQRNRCYK